MQNSERPPKRATPRPANPKHRGFFDKAAAAPPSKPPIPHKKPARPREDSGAMRPQGTGDHWLWGQHAVLQALGNPDRKLLRLIATEDREADPALREAVTNAADIVTVQIVTKEEIERSVPKGSVHQGLALLTRPLPRLVIEDVIERLQEAKEAIVLVLDQVTDPHNVGAILRSAAAFGATALIMQDRHAPDISGTLAKSASGAAEHLPIIRVTNLVRSLELLKQAGFWCIGLAGEAEATLASLKPTGRVCLVMGSEGDGMRRLTRESCDLMARLPTGGAIASLNVSNAAAIALYEIVRGRE